MTKFENQEGAFSCSFTKKNDVLDDENDNLILSQIADALENK